MKVSLLLTVLCLFSVLGKEWNRHLVLDPDGKYHVLWKVNGNNIIFQVEVETKGWVGFGISPNGEMTGSDVVIGWITNNRAVFHDRFAVRRSMPIIDDHQDWEYLWCCENDTHTTLRFSRRLHTCDEQDLPIERNTTWLIYAYHDEDPASPTTIHYHGGNRGTKPTLIFQRERRVQNYSKDVQFWDITSANVLIPHHMDTTYICTMSISPMLDKKHHIIRIEPLIQSGNERFIRFMILYKCPEVPENVIYPFRLKEYTECYTEDLITNFPFCQHIWATWAVGRGVFELPDHVGMPFEENGLYRLEVHYNNPDLEEGIYDNSGLRLAYSPNLRQYDSDHLTVGSLWHPCVFVPPNQNNFVTSGHAHPDCFKKGIQQEGIKVFAVSLHSHVMGKHITVRHFRGENELPPIASDNSYYFKYQEIIFLPEERTILPNDHLIVECTYDSTKRHQTTFGGLGNMQEVCLAYLSYYPKSSTQSSFSCPLPERVLNTIGVTEMTNNTQYVISPITGKNETYINFLRYYPWDVDSLNLIQHAIRYGPHISICSIGESVTVVSTKTTYPNIKAFYQEPDLCASRPSTTTTATTTTTTTTSPPQPQGSRATRPQPPRPTQPQTRPTEPKKKKKVPQTIPYELIDRIFIELG